MLCHFRRELRRSVGPPRRATESVKKRAERLVEKERQCKSSGFSMNIMSCKQRAERLGEETTRFRSASRTQRPGLASSRTDSGLASQGRRTPSASSERAVVAASASDESVNGAPSRGGTSVQKRVVLKKGLASTSAASRGAGPGCRAAAGGGGVCVIPTPKLRRY